MKTVINKTTGEKLFDTLVYDIHLNDNEELVDFIPSLDKIIIEEVPEQITALQFFTQLRKEGITKEAIIQVLEYLKSEGYISQEIFDVAIVAIDKATVIERNNDLLPLIGSAFEKSKEQLDLIFINANKI